MRTSTALRTRLQALWRRAVAIALSPFQAFKMLCFAVGLVVILVSTGVGLWSYRFYRTLPDLTTHEFSRFQELARRKITDRIEKKGPLPEWTPIQEISRDFLYTVIMSEDSGFFEHDGIDVEAILNSLAHNLKARKNEYGASTISQQVVKNLFLTSEKSVTRKLREFFLTHALERRLTKNQILELYLNLAEFGPDIYGVREAANQFFDKDPSAINAAEGAFMALMLPSPRRYHYAVFQNQNLPLSKKRKIRRILGDMLANEFISPHQYRDYLEYDFFGTRHPTEAEKRKPAGRPVRKRR